MGCALYRSSGNAPRQPGDASKQRGPAMTQEVHMQSDHSTPPRRRALGRLTALMLATASGMTAVAALAQTAPEACPPHRTAEVSCNVAAPEAMICIPPALLQAAYTGTVTIHVQYHANGGEACHLENGLGQPITNTEYIEPHDDHPRTFYHQVPQGTQFFLKCRRRWQRGNASIKGFIYYP
jgi:hypothetical protein